MSRIYQQSAGVRSPNSSIVNVAQSVSPTCAFCAVASMLNDEAVRPSPKAML